MRDQNYVLVGIGLITVACGFYYYLKVVRAMYWQPAPADATPIVASRLTGIAAVILSLLIILLGIFPKPLLDILP
jgi:NADH-quinone oxidoreductase subunit N